MNKPRSELFETFAIQGMDLRDYFAARALEQDIQEYLWERVGVYGKIARCTREEAKYKYADAMMKARDVK